MPGSVCDGFFCSNRNGYTTQGISISRLFAEAAQTPEIDSYGCNCLLGAAHMYKLIKAQNLAGDKFIQVLPNSGYQQIVRRQAGHADGVHYLLINGTDGRIGVISLADAAEPHQSISGCCVRNWQEKHHMKSFR